MFRKMNFKKKIEKIKKSMTPLDFDSNILFLFNINQKNEISK
jgi:hypothetical protein